jgi:hypothetical protein
MDLYQSVLTTLDPAVDLTLALVGDAEGRAPANTAQAIQEQSAQLGHQVTIEPVPPGPLGAYLVRQARDGKYDLLILPLPHDQRLEVAPWVDYVLRHAPCRVFLAAEPPLPQELAE